MNRKAYVWTLALVMIAALAGGLWSNGIATAQRPAATSSPRIQRLEYRMVASPNETDLVNQANGLGEQGWELTCVVPDVAGNARVFGYFKRSKP